MESSILSCCHSERWLDFKKNLRNHPGIFKILNWRLSYTIFQNQKTVVHYYCSYFGGLLEYILHSHKQDSGWNSKNLRSPLCEGLLIPLAAACGQIDMGTQAVWSVTSNNMSFGFLISRTGLLLPLGIVVRIKWANKHKATGIQRCLINVRSHSTLLPSHMVSPTSSLELHNWELNQEYIYFSFLLSFSICWPWGRHLVRRRRACETQVSPPIYRLLQFISAPTCVRWFECQVPCKEGKERICLLTVWWENGGPQGQSD